MTRRKLSGLFSVALAMGLMAGCGSEEEEHHGDIVIAVSADPSPATVGVEVEIEVTATEGEVGFLPNEVHIEITKVGDATPVELTVEAHEDHHKALYTFAAAGTYDIKAECHVEEDGHEEIYEETIQLVVE